MTEAPGHRRHSPPRPALRLCGGRGRPSRRSFARACRRISRAGSSLLVLFQLATSCARQRRRSEFEPCRAIPGAIDGGRCTARSRRFVTVAGPMDSHGQRRDDSAAATERLEDEVTAFMPDEDDLASPAELIRQPVRRSRTRLPTLSAFYQSHIEVAPETFGAVAAIVPQDGQHSASCACIARPAVRTAPTQSLRSGRAASQEQSAVLDVQREFQQRSTTRRAKHLACSVAITGRFVVSGSRVVVEPPPRARGGSGYPASANAYGRRPRPRRQPPTRAAARAPLRGLVPRVDPCSATSQPSRCNRTGQSPRSSTSYAQARRCQRSPDGCRPARCLKGITK